MEQMVSVISLGIFQKQDTDNTIVMDRDPKPVGEGQGMNAWLCSLFSSIRYIALLAGKTL